jgi:hypothetical protein
MQIVCICGVRFDQGEGGLFTRQVGEGEELPRHLGHLSMFNLQYPLVGPKGEVV